MKTEVSIEDVIADFYFSDNAITLKNIRSKINSEPDSDEVILNIDSPGGYVDIAWAVHDYLRTIDKPITAKINGTCASAATIIALAADSIEMTQNSKFMIHLPWTYTAGNSDELLEVVENLKVEENKIARLYADVTGRNIRAMMKLMKQAEFWDAEKAKDEGFVDVVKATNRKKKADQNRAMAIATLSGMSKEMKVAACINHQNVNIMSKERVNSKRTGMLAKIAKVLDGEPEVVDLFLSLADGREMEVVTNGEKPSVGDEVRVNNRPAEDGEYTTADGDIITVKNHEITKIDEDSAQARADKEEIKNLKQTISTLQNELGESKTQLSQISNQLTELKTSVDSYKNTVENVKKESDNKLNQITDIVRSVSTGDFSNEAPAQPAFNSQGDDKDLPKSSVFDAIEQTKREKREKKEKAGA